MDKESLNFYSVFDHVIGVMVQELVLNDRNKVSLIGEAIFSNNATYALYIKNKFCKQGFFLFKNWEKNRILSSYLNVPYNIS